MDNSGHKKKMTGNECNRKKNTTSSGISAIGRQRVLGCTSAMGKQFSLIIPGKLKFGEKRLDPVFLLENHIWSGSADVMKACG